MPLLATDLGTWSFILSILAIVLMYPVGVLINLTTPLVQNWLAKQTYVSLEGRIRKLESALAELEKNPPIDEVQNQILWGITNLKMRILAATSSVTAVIYLAVRVFAPPGSPSVTEFSVFTFIVITSDTVGMLALRYHHGFRYSRSPKVRENLRAAIRDLKNIRDSWAGDH